MTGPTEVQPVPYRPRMARRAKLLLGTDELAGLIDLPSGMRVTHVTVLWDPMTVAVIVEGDGLGEVPEDCESPMLRGGWDRRGVLGEDGRMYVRFGWQADDMPDAKPGLRAGVAAETGTESRQDMAPGASGALQVPQGGYGSSEGLEATEVVSGHLAGRGKPSEAAGGDRA